MEKWCRLNKDIEILVSFIAFEGNTRTTVKGNNKTFLSKGTYIQTSKKHASMYIKSDNGFWFFSQDDLEEVNIDPSCFFSELDGIPIEVKEKEDYQDYFMGNPEDWFLDSVNKVYQG